MYDARRYLVVERPSGQLAITTAQGLGSQKLRKDMKVIRRPNGDLLIVKRHRRRHDIGEVEVNRYRGALEVNGVHLDFGITHLKITGELARLYYLHMLLNR